MKKKYVPGWRQIKPEEPLNVVILKEYLTKVFEDNQINKPWTGIINYQWKADGTVLLFLEY